MALGYLGATLLKLPAKVAIFGVPFDGTASYRAGSRFGPQALRQASESLETYSPFLSRDLDDLNFTDLGDLEVPPGNAARMLEIVEAKTEEILTAGAAPAMMGGEHTVTLGVIRALVKRYPDLHLIQLDAHTDMRDEYLGEKYSHATVIRRIMEIIPPANIYRLGIRAGLKEEMELAGITLPIDGCLRNIEQVMNSIPEQVPLYVTIDLDIFDPSLIPGTGNPEPMGITYREYIQLVRFLSNHNVVGFDVVELAPELDQSGVSSIVAASVMREMLLSMAK